LYKRLFLTSNETFLCKTNKEQQKLTTRWSIIA